MEKDNKFWVDFIELLQDEEYEYEIDNKRKLSYATCGFVRRVIWLFDPENSSEDEENDAENREIIESLFSARGVEEWIKEQVQYFIDDDGGDFDELEVYFGIGDADESEYECFYKNSDEFFNDFDYEMASKIIKECYEKASKK